MDNNLNQDLTHALDVLDKLTDELKIVEITVTATSIDDGTMTVMSFPTENNISSTQENIVLEEDESFEDEISSNDDYEDEINTPYDSDDGIYRDEEERAQAEYNHDERTWERIVMENQ